jgi:Family of unknown function (DUF5677)
MRHGAVCASRPHLVSTHRPEGRTLPDGSGVDPGPLSRDAQDDWAFSAAVELRDAGKTLLEDIAAAEEWKMRPGALENVFQGTFARGTQTFRSVLLLCDRGYGVQAGMLNRSLFEHAVVLWWMHLHDDREWLMDRLRKHHEHSRVLWDRAAAAHPELELPLTTKLRPLDEETIAELDRLFGEYGGTWHGESLFQLVRAVEKRWEEPYQGMFWKFLRFVNQWNNSMLHHSSAGIADAIEWTNPSDPPVLTLGPDRAWSAGSSGPPTGATACSSSARSESCLLIEPTVSANCPTASASVTAGSPEAKSLSWAATILAPVAAA